MMKINEKEKGILERYFDIHENDDSYELENWTDGGVNMIIYISKCNGKSVLEQLQEFVRDFDLDEEVDLYRQDKSYKENFTIKESVADFENWLNLLGTIIDSLLEIDDEIDDEDTTDDEDITDDETDDDEIEMLNCVGVKDTENGLEIILFGNNKNILSRYNIEINIKNYNEFELFDICYNISNNIKNFYYNNNGVITRENVLNIVRAEVVK